MTVGIDINERQLEELLRTGYTEYRTGPNAAYPTHTWVKLNKRAEAYARRLLEGLERLERP